MLRSLPKICFVLYAIALTTVSLLPAETLLTPTINDKIAHFLSYALFALLAATFYSAGKPYLMVCAALALYGLSIEGAQSLVPGRDSSLLDALANSAGVALGFVAVSLYCRVRHRSPTM